MAFEQVTTSRSIRALQPPPETGIARPGGLCAGIAAPHPLFWTLTAGITLIDAVWLAWAGIRVEAEGFRLAALGVGALLVAAAALSRLKSEPKLRGMALGSASLVAFTVPTAVLHYLTATWGLPLVDAQLAGAERVLGIDWTAYVAFLATHPTLARWLALAYHSSGPQIVVVVIVLSATGRLGRLWAFVRLFSGTLLCVVAISALLPAVGPYAHYQPAIAPPDSIETVGALWHLSPLAQLREGTMRTIALGDIRGLATFPSFHACLAVLTAWALAPIPVLAPLVLALNAAVVVATVGAGGHYVPDVLAGLILAATGLILHAARGRGALALAMGWVRWGVGEVRLGRQVRAIPPAIRARVASVALRPAVDAAGRRSGQGLDRDRVQATPSREGAIRGVRVEAFDRT